MFVKFKDILELVDLPNGKTAIYIKSGVDRRLVGKWLLAGWEQHLKEKYGF
jgi:hypothetical protein